MNIPTCCITGHIAGDTYACGDCDPCILGASSVPKPVKKLIGERDEWASKYAEAMEDREELRAALRKIAEFPGQISDAGWEMHGIANRALEQSTVLP